MEISCQRGKLTPLNSLHLNGALTITFPVLPSTFFFRKFTLKAGIFSKSNKSQDLDQESQKNGTKLLQYSITLAVISTSLPAQAKVSEKKRSSKKTESLSFDELKSWCGNLPIVDNRIPYSELISLKQQGKLKHIIKLPTLSLRNRPDPVLVVLDDSRILRTVLPTIERDAKFWENWDRLNLNSACVNAYTLPIKKPELPSPYLGWVANIPGALISFMKGKPKSKKVWNLRGRERNWRWREGRRWRD